MNPEVLVWALLFVVGFGLAYRVSAWSLTRDRPLDGTSSATPVRHAEPAPAGDDDAEAMTAAPVRSSEPTAMRPPSPRSVETANPTAPPFAAHVSPIVAASVLATLARAQTPTPVDRPQEAVLITDVRATLAPRDIATAVEAPADLPPVDLPPVDLPPVDLPPRSDAPAPAVVVDADAVLAPGMQSVTIRRRGTQLRARRVAIDTPPLDQRIKKTRARKPLAAPKSRSKQATVRDNVEPAIAPKTYKRGPLRRIGLKPEDGNALASTKATTKIIGLPRPDLRVRLAPAG